MKISQQAALGILLAIVPYVLSVGPIMGNYFDRDTMPPTAAMIFYAPLGWCCRVCPPLAGLMNQYIRFLVPNA